MLGLQQQRSLAYAELPQSVSHLQLSSDDHLSELEAYFRLRPDRPDTLIYIVRLPFVLVITRLHLP